MEDGISLVDSRMAVELSKHDLEVLTDNFSDKNFITHAQFCKVYHGNIPDGLKGLEGRKVTVKVWVDYKSTSQKQIMDWGNLVENYNFELGFLHSTKATCCGYLPELIAYARDDDIGFLGVVYDFQSSDTLRNFVEQAEFKWLERIKVAVGLAHLLRFLIHENPRYLVRDLNAGNIMLDKDQKPVLFNFFMLVGVMDVVEPAVIFERAKYGQYGYLDFAHPFTGLYREFSDVFAFGVILCELLFKRQVDRNFQRGSYNYIYHDARKLYPLESPECSFADQSYEKHRNFDAQDAAKLSRLARLCVDEEPEVRPNMQEVVEMLGELHVVRNYAANQIRVFELLE